METLWQKYGGSVQFVAVNMKETLPELMTWIGGLPGGVTFPILHSTDGSIVNLYASGMGTVYWPLIYIIDANGVVQKIFDEGLLLGETEMEGHILDVLYTRPAIDLELVTDVSSSMLSPSPAHPTGDSKLTMLQQTAQIILDLMVDHGQSDDKMGIARFSDNASEYEHGGKKLLAVPTNDTRLGGAITDLPLFTGTCTAMGAGLQAAFDTLTSEGTQKRFVILCTDGMQNIEPKVAPAGGHYEIIDSGGWLCGGHSSTPPHPGTDIRNYNAKIHTVGIGISASYEPLLQAIADQTGGFYRATHDPVSDLDLIYTANLCNCMAEGSPSLIAHLAGTFVTERCFAAETFEVNRSTRKLTVVLSWPESEKCDLTFWLYAPDGTLLDLSREMRACETYRKATLYLPKEDGGRKVPHVGQWRMVIRGETAGGKADYHVVVVGEDHEIKTVFDYPRKAYAVGDLVPLRLTVTENGKPALKFTDIRLEVTEPRVPLSELLHRLRVSSFELHRLMAPRGGKTESPEAQLYAKLRVLERSPSLRESLKPVRRTLSLRDGTLPCEFRDGEAVIPYALQMPGLHGFKVAARLEDRESGPVCRTDYLSLTAGPGPADKAKSTSAVSPLEGKGFTGLVATLTPRNERGHLLGPGHGGEFTASAGGKALPAEVEDRLDGSYRVEIPAAGRGKARRGPIVLKVGGVTLWEGTM